MKKRALCLLLAVLLCVSLLPLPAMAAGDPVEINNTNFPDNIFRDYVSSNFDENGDGSLSQTEIAATTYINVYNRSISDLTGIEHFTGLTRLDCDNNQLTSLDISRNPHLVEAYIKGEKREFGIYTRYSVSGIDLRVDSHVKIVCLSVTAQPKDQTAEAGKKATFSVEASGQDLTYQWYVQKKGESAWTELTGETKQELTVTAAEELDGGSYKCRVYCVGVRETFEEESKAATLTVKTEPEETEPKAPEKPRITSQPKSRTVKAGKKVTFKVKATGGNLKYQWYVKKTGSKKWVKVKKATRPTLKFKATAKMNGYRYRCKVYNEAGYKYSRTVKLKVKKK